MVKGEQTPLNTKTAAYTPGSFIVPPQFPPMPANFCPFGYVVIKVAEDYTAGAKYVFGSNTTATGAQNSAATAYANTFASVFALPDRPQVS
jgi:hypothetical protein